MHPQKEYSPSILIYLLPPHTTPPAHPMGPPPPLLPAGGVPYRPPGGRSAGLRQRTGHPSFRQHVDRPSLCRRRGCEEGGAPPPTQAASASNSASRAQSTTSSYKKREGWRTSDSPHSNSTTAHSTHARTVRRSTGEKVADSATTLLTASQELW